MSAAADRGFMMTARAQALLSPSSLRSTSSKRKLEEFEIGMTDPSVSATSQVRARREARDEVQEGSIAESSGRERYEAGGAIGAAEAQSLDGETEMREEDGNAALDDDTTWDEQPSRISGMSSEGVCESSKEPPDKIEEANRMDEGSSVDMINDDHGSSLQVFLGGPTVVVDFGSSPYGSSGARNMTHSSSSTVSMTTSGPIGVEVFEVEGIDVCRYGGEYDASAGRGDVEAGKEAAELDGLRAREMERDGVIEGEEESASGGYGSSNTVAGVPGESSASSSASMGFQNLSSSSSSSSMSSLAGGSSVGRNSNEVTARVDTGSATPMELSPTRLQFFVRTLAHTIVLQAYGSDLAESVHQQILLKSGLPISEQRPIFGRLQLQQDQTLESCHVANDATLTLVARMRSTALPASWQLINDLVSTIRHMCAVGDPQGQLGLKLMHSQDCVRASVQEFLKMAVKSVPVSEHMQVFELAGATSALVMLLLSLVDTNRECAEDSINLFLAANDEYLPAHIHCYCAPVLLDFCKLLAKSDPAIIFMLLAANL